MERGSAMMASNPLLAGKAHTLINSDDDDGDDLDGEWQIWINVLPKEV